MSQTQAPSPTQDPAPAMGPRVTLMGVAIDAVREADCVSRIVDAARQGRGGWVVTPNLDHLRRLTTDAGFRRLCASAELKVADGMPLIWASRLQGTPLPERVAGSNLISSLSAAAADAGLSVYLLGGDPGTAEGAAAVLQDRHPQLKIAGHLCPEFGFEKDPEALEDLRQRLREAAPDIVFVALGSPKQEQVIELLRSSCPKAWWLGIGISFSFLTGDVKRAPRWLQSLGLEWVHRLAQEPRRLMRRYLVQGLPFACRLMFAALRSRLSRSRRGSA